MSITPTHYTYFMPTSLFSYFLMLHAQQRGINTNIIVKGLG